jgi:hypothetical protein
MAATYICNIRIKYPTPHRPLLTRKEPKAWLWYLDHGATNGSIYQYEGNWESKVVMLWFKAVEAGGSMFVRNIVKVLLDYMASRPRRWHFYM